MFSLLSPHLPTLAGSHSKTLLGVSKAANVMHSIDLINTDDVYSYTGSVVCKGTVSKL